MDLAHGRACEFRLTQSELPNALGATPVHVNRVLKGLLDKGWITLGDGRLVIHKWDALAEAADFDPGYLHFRRDDPRHRASMGEGACPAPGDTVEPIDEMAPARISCAPPPDASGP